MLGAATASACANIRGVCAAGAACRLRCRKYVPLTDLPKPVNRTSAAPGTLGRFDLSVLIITNSMGIDIYAEWDGMTEAEEGCADHWLQRRARPRRLPREAYHGEPYATKVLVPEAFEELRVPSTPTRFGIACRPRWSWRAARARNLRRHRPGRDQSRAAKLFATSSSCARARKLRQASPVSS